MFGRGRGVLLPVGVASGREDPQPMNALVDEIVLYMYTGSKGNVVYIRASAL